LERSTTTPKKESDTHGRRVVRFCRINPSLCPHTVGYLRDYPLRCWHGYPLDGHLPSEYGITDVYALLFL
jgi:hypothetical protein